MLQWVSEVTLGASLHTCCPVDISLSTKHTTLHQRSFPSCACACPSRTPFPCHHSGSCLALLPLFLS